MKDGQECRTLDAIRGFLPEQLDLLEVENRVLNVSIFELKRPVKYFWSLHDFIEGLRGALKGMCPLPASSSMLMLIQRHERT